MFLLFLVETTDTFDGNIVRFRRSTGEDNLLRLRIDQLGHFLNRSSEVKRRV